MPSAIASYFDPVTYTGPLTALTFNGNTFTVGTGTLTLVAGKTATISNTLTLTATDGSTLAIGAGGTLGTLAYQNANSVPAITLAGTVSGGGQTLSNIGLLLVGTAVDNLVDALQVSGSVSATGAITGASYSGGAISGTMGTFSDMLNVNSGAISTVGDLTFVAQLSNNLTAYNASPKSGIMFLVGYDAGGNEFNAGGIMVGKENATDSNVASYLSLHTRTVGGAPLKRVTFDSVGSAIFTPDGSTVIGTLSTLGLAITGIFAVSGAFGCNGATAQTPYVSGGAAGGTATNGGWGFVSAAEFNAFVALSTNMRAAMVAQGTMS